MGTLQPEKTAETPSAQGFGYFSRSKFGLSSDSVDRWIADRIAEATKGKGA